MGCNHVSRKDWTHSENIYQRKDDGQNKMKMKLLNVGQCKDEKRRFIHIFPKGLQQRTLDNRNVACQSLKGNFLLFCTNCQKIDSIDVIAKYVFQKLLD